MTFFKRYRKIYGIPKRGTSEKAGASTSSIQTILNKEKQKKIDCLHQNYTLVQGGETFETDLKG